MNLKEQILNECITDNKLNKYKCSSSWMNKHEEYKNYLNELYPNIDNYGEKIYLLKNNLTDKPLCKCGCGKYTKYINFNTGYNDYATNKCKRISDTFTKIENKINPEDLEHNKIYQEIKEKFKEKIKNYCMEKYGI